MRAKKAPKMGRPCKTPGHPILNVISTRVNGVTIKKLNALSTQYRVKLSDIVRWIVVDAVRSEWAPPVRRL